MDAEETVKIAKWVIDNPEISLEAKATILHRVGNFFTDSWMWGEGTAAGLDDEFEDKLIPWLRRQVKSTNQFLKKGVKTLDRTYLEPPE